MLLDGKSCTTNFTNSQSLESLQQKKKKGRWDYFVILANHRVVFRVFFFHEYDRYFNIILIYNCLGNLTLCFRLPSVSRNYQSFFEQLSLCNLFCFFATVVFHSNESLRQLMARD